MTADQFLWVLARVTGLSAYVALALALLTGAALRSAVLEWLAGNRALRSVHEYVNVLWIPLGAVHVLALLGDSTARIGWLDVIVPFHSAYGTLAIGLGAAALDVLVVVALSAWLRRSWARRHWTWLHRLAYAAFALIFLHAALSGTDFSDALVSAIGWGVAAMLLTVSLARALWGRLPA